MVQYILGILNLELIIEIAVSVRGKYMVDEVQTTGFWNDLDKVAQVRHDLADSLDKVAQIITISELEGEKNSGKLGLEHDIERLKTKSSNLRQGVFRLLVLGDMKRGKSTFLNALLGENLLPSDVSPCTALLTIIRYGETQKVSIHYKDGRIPEEIDFHEFKERYTINPEETKALENDQQIAFPDVSHAVVEHPLPLLGKGIEFIDSPGLNDTEARNELSLTYLYKANAVLFIMSASQPCTLEERRYIQNYLREKGLNVFFLINAWDKIRSGLVDPENTEELQEAESKVREVFKNNLRDYLQDNNISGSEDSLLIYEQIYKQRVFEISALQALRTRLKDQNADLEGTGFPEFLHSLNNYLTKDRANVEFKQARETVYQVSEKFNQAIERRIPLLDNDVTELEKKINSVKSEFEKLSEIADKFRQDIVNISDEQAKKTADSFKEYILNLEHTFETDFAEHQPDLEFSQFFNKDNRAEFYKSFKRAFERYLNDRLSAWEFTAKEEIASAFTRLEEKAKNYKVEYEKVLETINKKLLGYRFYAVENKYNQKQAYTWADTVFDVFESIPDSLNQGINSFNMFWRSVFVIVCATVILNIIGLIFASLTLSFFGAILAGAGIFTLQAEYVRRQFISATKKEFTKHLPTIARDQYQPVYDGVKSCFDAYEKQLVERVNNDINSRQSELNNLLKQKQSREVNLQQETLRLTNFVKDISSEIKQINSIYKSF
ncbi:MAG: dynamin family protein [Cyanobacteria bacterium P01_A01_bin.45]